MARSVHSLSYPSSIFTIRNCNLRRIRKTCSYSTAAQPADDTTPPTGPSISPLELNRSITRKSIGAEQLTPVKNAILKPFSNPFSCSPLNYDSLWYNPPTFDALIDSHLAVLDSYEYGNNFLRVSAKRYLYFINAIFSESILPGGWKFHALDRVAQHLRRQHRALLLRPRRRRSPAELLDRNERLLILLNSLFQVGLNSWKASDSNPALRPPQSLIELCLEMAVECRSFTACMSYLQWHVQWYPKMSSRLFAKVLRRLGEPPQYYAKYLALRPFRTWDSSHAAMVLVGGTDLEAQAVESLYSVLDRTNPACFKLWLETLVALSRWAPDLRYRLVQRIEMDYTLWQNSLRTDYINGLMSGTRHAAETSPDRINSFGRAAASELDICFLESFVKVGEYTSAWEIFFHTKVAFKALSPSVRRALMQNPLFELPQSRTKENEVQLLSIYEEYCRAIEGALGVQWVRDEATGEFFHQNSTDVQRTKKSRASKGRRRRRVSRHLKVLK